MENGLMTEVANAEHMDDASGCFDDILKTNERETYVESECETLTQNEEEQHICKCNFAKFCCENKIGKVHL